MVVRFVRYKNVGWTIQIAILHRGGIDKFLSGRYAVPFQHDDEQFRFDDWTGEKQSHNPKWHKRG